MASNTGLVQAVPNISHTLYALIGGLQSYCTGFKKSSSAVFFSSLASSHLELCFRLDVSNNM